ncbi:MAG: PepSY-associated TM helix domain-containing protein [Advenella sp.]|uniref:PepSY-associated TM helix domain-containing protein n=1 Tax=Advenella sp. TaxID=1872388 RepID=UPI003F9E66F9
MSHLTPIPAKGAAINFLRRIHFYVGLFIAPFIFVAALTGTLYVLTPQLENAIYADTLYINPQGTARPLSEQIEAAQDHVGRQANIYAVRPAPEATNTTRVQFADASYGASESRAIFVDPYTLQIKGDMMVYGTSGVLPIRLWLDKAHRTLLLGDLGRNYSELAASWLWAAALGGLLLWFSTRTARKGPRKGSAFLKNRHWHTTLGLMLFVGLIFVSVTGLTWSRWAGDNINQLRANMGWLTPQVNTTLAQDAHAMHTDPHAEHHAAMAGTAQSTQDWPRVVAAARQAGIRSSMIEIRAPKEAGKAWTVTEVDRRWPTQVDAVAVNPQDFSIVDRTEFNTFPLVAKLTRWGVDTHMGILFGLPNQLLLIAFGIGLCVMIALGYRMWWLRRPVASGSNPARTLVAAWMHLPTSLKAISVVIAALLGYALPLMGVSLLAFIVLDIIRWKRGNSRSAVMLRSGA